MHAARLTIRLGASPAATYVRLIRGDGRSIVERGANAATENLIELGVSGGDYFVQVSCWGGCNPARPPRVPLLISAVAAADALEPNDEPSRARLLQSGEEIRGCLLPRGDSDIFRFRMERPGTIRVFGPAHSIPRYVSIRDARGESKREGGFNGGNKLELVAGVAAGDYTLNLTAWGGGLESLEPYCVRFESVEDDGRGDAIRKIADPRPASWLGPNALTGATINPAGEIDRYEVNLPSAGRLHVRAVGPIPHYLIVRPADGEGRVETGINAATPGEVVYDAPGPMTLLVQISGWGGDQWAPSPYTLRTWWEPCDELEAMQRNETREAATPFLPGDALRGSVLPIGDVDLHQLDVAHPAHVRLGIVSPSPTYVRILDSQGTCLREAGVNPGTPSTLEADLLPGDLFVQISGWGADRVHAGAYAITTALERAEPMERVPLADDPIRPLLLARAQPFVIDSGNDRDRFSFSTPHAGKLGLRLYSPAAAYLKVFDEHSGQEVAEGGCSAGKVMALDLHPKGPTWYRLEVTGWGGDQRSALPGYILADPKGREIVAEKVEIRVDPVHPESVTFTRVALHPLAGGRSMRVDADGDGRVDFELPGSGDHTFTYAAQGLYAATATREGTNGTSTLQRWWVDATGAHERTGVRLTVQPPAQGQMIDRSIRCRPQVASYTGRRVARVEVTADQRLLAAVYSPPYELDIPWESLEPGSHRLTFTASDATGETASVRRTVRVSDYFDLLPEDGAVVSGDAVTVSWTGQSFGPAVVRHRVKGESAWQETQGESARQRHVRLSGLVAGTVYEFQPVGGEAPGPARTVTRVKGLAFGKGLYSASIARDYDQKVGVSVRNNGDKPLVVRLECGRTPDATLLVGFVGEGSAGAPFTLKPSEEREFMLGISAQDVVTAVHRFPIRLVSSDGLTDQAEVELHVKLPVVKLEWETLGPEPGTLGCRYRLNNRGDTLTDLSIVAEDPGVTVSPDVRHGLLPGGGSLEVIARPRLFDGFRGVRTRLVARAIGRESAQTFQVSLKDDQRVFVVDLTPGVTTRSTTSTPASTTGPASYRSPREDNLARIRAMVGATLDPRQVDWSRRTRPEDTDGDGKPDRWRIWDEAGGILWVGDDTDGDGMVDFVHAD
ncbi:MAG: hypothetical protein HY815_21715, partial [Candidatus Riflebacteria bacterium]|nr:hypothetical protein [Candidatus Riflebacteria bacterium]